MTMMRRSIAAFVSAAIVMSAGIAGAAVSKSDAKCRKTFQKALSKYNDTIHKTVAGCWKDVLKGKLPDDTDCNSLSVADEKGKADKARMKLEDKVGGDKTKCEDDANATALAEFSGGCPSPATGPISNWIEARDCAIAITEFRAEQLWRYSFNPPQADVVEILGSKSLSKCAAAIHKAAIKLASRAGKERGKSQAASDKIGGSYDYLAGNSDDKDKIAKAELKLADQIEKQCATLSKAEFASLHSCRTEASGLEQCLTGVWERNGSGVTSMAYEQAGICPSSVIVRTAAGKGGGVRLNETRLDAGWTGIGHNIDLIDDFKSVATLSCSDSTCAECSPTLLCDPAIRNCRCANDVTIDCTMPNAADPACSGNTCEYRLTPPLPLNVSNAPACAINKVVSELDAIVPNDIGTGVQSTGIPLVAVVYSGLEQNQPCPTCSGAAIGDAGTCDGGPRDGLACTTDATHVAFGETSNDCPPNPGANVSGAGLILDLVLGDTTPDFTMGTDCTFASGMSGLKCACALCTGGGNIPCNGNADCAGLPLSCSDDSSPCSNNGDCTPAQCADNAASCSTNSDCARCDTDLSPCATNGDCAPRCDDNLDLCATNADCKRCSDDQSPCVSNLNCTMPATCNTGISECTDADACSVLEECLPAATCGAQTCTTTGIGLPTQPNACSDLVCTDGECAAGFPTDFVNYCDGYVRGDGSGILVCNSNTDCAFLDEICPNGDCGTCTLTSVRSCFTSGLPGELITASGTPGADGAVLVTNFCIPPSSSGSINSGAGLPGPARMHSRVRYEFRCADGTPWQFPGGSNCQ